MALLASLERKRSLNLFSVMGSQRNKKVGSFKIQALAGGRGRFAKGPSRGRRRRDQVCRDGCAVLRDSDFICQEIGNLQRLLKPVLGMI